MLKAQWWGGCSLPAAACGYQWHFLQLAFIFWVPAKAGLSQWALVTRAMLSSVCLAQGSFCNVTACLTSCISHNQVWSRGKPMRHVPCRWLDVISHGCCPLVAVKIVTLQNIPQRDLVIRRKQSGPFASLRGTGLQCRRKAGVCLTFALPLMEVSQVSVLFFLNTSYLEWEHVFICCVEHLVCFWDVVFPRKGTCRRAQQCCCRAAPIRVVVQLLVPIDCSLRCMHYKSSKVNHKVMSSAKPSKKWITWAWWLALGLMRCTTYIHKI